MSRRASRRSLFRSSRRYVDSFTPHAPVPKSRTDLCDEGVKVRHGCREVKPGVELIGPCLGLDSLTERRRDAARKPDFKKTEQFLAIGFKNRGRPQFAQIR